MVGETVYKRMLLCVTEATPNEAAETAVRLCSKDTEVYVLHVVHILSEFVRKDVTERFSWVTDLFNKAGVKSRLEIVESPDIGRAIISFAKKNSCDAIVTGTIPKKGLLGALSDSVSDYLVKNAPSTVILVRKAGQPV